jgi:hypothetical protein
MLNKSVLLLATGMAVAPVACAFAAADTPGNAAAPTTGYSAGVTPSAGTASGTRDGTLQTTASGCCPKTGVRGATRDSPRPTARARAHAASVSATRRQKCTSAPSVRSSSGRGRWHSGAIAGAFGVAEIASSSPRRPASVGDDGHGILERCRRNVKVPQSGQVGGRDVVAPHQRDLVARE